MKLQTIRNIVNLKSLLLWKCDKISILLYDKTNMTYVDFVESIIINILSNIHRNPRTHMDHFILSEDTIQNFKHNTFVYREYDDTNNELLTYIKTVQPCYKSWIQILWKQCYGNTKILHISPLFLEFLYTIVQFPYLI
jgi:hypothetical protein